MKRNIYHRYKKRLLSQTYNIGHTCVKLESKTIIDEFTKKLIILFSVPANCEYIDLPGSYLPFTDTYVANVANLEACR